MTACVRKRMYMSTDEMALKDGGEQMVAKQALPSLLGVLFSCCGR